MVGTNASKNLLKCPQVFISLHHTAAADGRYACLPFVFGGSGDEVGLVPLFLSKQRRLRRSRVFLAFLSVNLPPVVSHQCDDLARDCCRSVMHDHPTPEIFGRNRQSVWRIPPPGVCQQLCARETQKNNPPTYDTGDKGDKGEDEGKGASTTMLSGELVSLISNKRYVVNQTSLDKGNENSQGDLHDWEPEA